ncbi:MAG: FecR domain-containing protein, partial [Spirochaetes bacterium]|nr:FecR domain-containing protein [Spirochaetota bacterium]
MVNRLTIKDIVEYAAGLYSGEKKNNIEKSINESDSSKKTFKLFKSGLTSHKLARLHDADLVFKNILAKVEQNKSSKKNVFRPAYKRTLRKSFYMAGSIASTAVVLFLMMTALLKNPGILKTSQFYGYPKVTFNGKSLNIKKGFLIPEKAMINTSKDSKIYLSFNAGKIRILQNSKFIINKLSISGKKSVLHISQRSGALLVKVKQNQLKSMSINTPHSLLTVTGTSFSVLVSAEQTDVAVLKGRVRVTSKTTRKTTDLN